MMTKAPMKTSEVSYSEFHLLLEMFSFPRLTYLIVYGFFNDTVSSWYCMVSNIWYSEYQLEEMWKEIIVA
jgi:hypothetical protein